MSIKILLLTLTWLSFRQFWSWSDWAPAAWSGSLAPWLVSVCWRSARWGIDCSGKLPTHAPCTVAKSGAAGPVSLVPSLHRVGGLFLARCFGQSWFNGEHFAGLRYWLLSSGCFGRRLACPRWFARPSWGCLTQLVWFSCSHHYAEVTVYAQSMY